MKVTLLKEDKKYITLEEAPIVRQIIANMKEDESTPADYVKTAIRAAYNYDVSHIEILKASAKITKNNRAWNNFSDNSGKFDIWIDAIAYINVVEFIIIGIYLTDIWQVTGSAADENIVSHMYIRRFKEID